MQRAIPGRLLQKLSPIDLAALGHVYAVSGKRNQALGVLRELRRLAAERYVSGYDFALVHLGLGDENAGGGARLDPLRADTRFQDLLRCVGLPL